MAKFATPFGFSAEGFVPGGEAGLESFFARPPYEQQFIREQGRSPTRSESETGVYDVTPKSPFDLTPGAWYEGMPTPDPYNVQGNIIHAGLSPEIESRIQQDASRGLFDVNERSVAQLGPLTGQSNWKPLTGTSKLIVDALTEGRLKGDPADMARGREDLIRRRARIPSFRPFIGKGGLTAAAIASSLFSPRAEAPMLAPRRDYPDKTHPLQGQAIAFSDEDSPFRQQLPHNVYQPQKEPGLWDRTKGFFGSLSPFSEAEASMRPASPDEIFKPCPVDPFKDFWGARYASPSRGLDISDSSLESQIGPNVTYTPPPPIPTNEEYWNQIERRGREAVEESRMATKEALEELVEPFVKPYTKSGAAGQPELQALSQLAQIDPTLAERYAPGSQALQDITSQVESFEGAPGTTWTQSVPDISDILKTYVPPKAAQEPYVEQFEEITPPKKVVKKKVKKKVKKAKPGPKKAKVKAKVSKAPPRRVKYTPPKPKSKTPVTRRKGGKPKVRRVSKAPRRPGGR